MNKPLLLSLAAASLLTTTLNAESMYDRFNAMEQEMNKLENEIVTLKNEAKIAKEVQSDFIKNNKIRTLQPEPQINEEELEINEALTLKALSKNEEEPEDEETQEEIDEEESDENNEDNEESDDDDEEDDEEMDIKEEINDIHESISDLYRATNGSHLKLGVDYRFSLENLQYKMADGSKESNDAFMTNRLWINMNWSATKNLSFTGQLAYNKAFGARSGSDLGNEYETFDWIANENAYDDIVRVRSAYFLYRNDTFFGASVPWTFSVGRRPSTNGHLINLRDDDNSASPMGHTINVGFDGLSSKFNFEDILGLDGMYIKLCAGRGLSNAVPKFSATPYAQTDMPGSNPDIDLVGLIFVPYSDGQYSINSQYYYASNLIDQKTLSNPADGFDTVGGLHSFTANVVINGLGNEINDYLDDTTLFISGAVSITNPKSDKRMLYGAADFNGPTESGESKTGYSVWAGIQMPSVLSEDGNWGIEYNYGSQYWRSITYSEDTNIGSKVAARGSAYEAYFTEYLIEDILSLQVRYTYIDYDYTGSNGFFGETSGAAISIQDAVAFGMGASVVDTAQDIRFYLRYKY